MVFFNIPGQGRSADSSPPLHTHSSSVSSLEVGRYLDRYVRWMVRRYSGWVFCHDSTTPTPGLAFPPPSLICKEELPHSRL